MLAYPTLWISCFIWVLYWLLLICLSIWVRYLPVLMLRVSATLYCGNWFLKGKFTRFIFDKMTCFGECMISKIISIIISYVMCPLLVTTNKETVCLSLSQDLPVRHWSRSLDRLTNRSQQNILNLGLDFCPNNYKTSKRTVIWNAWSNDRNMHEINDFMTCTKSAWCSSKCSFVWQFMWNF